MKITKKSTFSFSPNKQLLLNSLLDHDFRLEEIDGTDVLLLNKNDHHSFLIGHFLPTLPYNWGLILSNKNFVLRILEKKKIVIPKGELCEPGNMKRAEKIAEEIGFPLAIRQENAQLDFSACLDLENITQFHRSFTTLSQTGQQ